MKKILVAFFMFFVCTLVLNASDELNLKAKSAVAIEASTKKILYEKNSKELMPPASMTKIMTMLLTMEALEEEKISLEDDVLISKDASSMGGSQIYLEAGKTAKVKDLLMSIAIGSANDAAYAMGEKIGGSIDNFILMMNKKAKELGANNTTFKNPHGLDEEGHLTTAFDMAIIASELVKYEDILNYTGTYETTIKHANGQSIWLVNTNSLIKFYSGLDGLKTGYTSNAGYCLTGTMKRNDMRVITVVMNEETKENRNTDTINLMEYSFANYYKKTILTKDKPLGKIFIDNASKREVPYYLKEDISLVLDKNVKDIKYSFDIELNEVKAPLNKGDVVGKLILNYNNSSLKEDLIVKEDIKKASFLTKLKNSFIDIISGNINVIK